MIRRQARMRKPRAPASGKARAHGPAAASLGDGGPAHATSSLQLTSRIFGNMMADCIEVVMVSRLLLKPPVLPYSFFICASGICIDCDLSL